MRLHTIVLLTLALTATACAAVDGSAISTDAGAADAGTVERCGDLLTTELAPLVEGLLYTSESDFPLTPVSWASAALDLEAVRALAGIDASAVAETRDFDALFDRIAVPQEWMDEGQKAAAERYAGLRRWMEANLTGLRVLRFGTVRIELFIVGQDGCGGVAGLRTVSIET
jgi:hypothetical protein